MAYSSTNHTTFSKRVDAWVKNFQASLEEFARLNTIYTNETASGADSEFIDTGNGTKEEHISMIVFGRELEDFVDGSSAVSQTDRRSNLSPFLQ